MADTDQTDLTALTVQLLSAYVTNNTVPSEDLANLIQSTHNALSTMNAPVPASDAPPTPEFVAAVSVRKSLGSKDHIISMIDGKPYKMLKRHLASHGITPNEYRQRYGLPKTYPMVAPSYSEQRRSVAEKLGLGRRVTPASAKAEAQAASPAIATDTPKETKPRKATTKVKKPAAAEATVATPAPAPAKTRQKRATAAAKPAAVSKAKTAKAPQRAAKPVEAASASVEKPAARRGRKPAAQPAGSAN